MQPSSSYDQSLAVFWWAAKGRHLGTSCCNSLVFPFGGRPKAASDAVALFQISSAIYQNYETSSAFSLVFA
jgi:hypothetical protein